MLLGYKIDISRSLWLIHITVSSISISRRNEIRVVNLSKDNNRVPLRLLESLRVNLDSVLSGNYSQDHLNRLIAVCHALAVTLLRSKFSAGKINIGLAGLSFDDLAYDCIADLFQRNEDGKVIQLNAYFEGLDCAAATEQVLLSHLRRLVFSKVTQGLFRVYQECDPALGKILRNVKLAINLLGNFTEVERFGETCIAPSLCDQRPDLPSFDPYELRTILFGQIKRNDRIPDIIAKLSLVLRQQELNSRIVPLIPFALMLRAYFADAGREESSNPSVEADLLTEDVRSIIAKATNTLKQEMHEKYVGRRKVCEAEFDNYFLVIQDKLTTVFIGRNGEDFSFYEGLRSLSPDVTREVYHKKHKNIIEYLARLAYGRVVEQFRKE